MLQNFVNFSLIFSVSINLILGWLLLRQKAKPPIQRVFVWMVAFFVLDHLALLVLVSQPYPQWHEWFCRIHYALTCVLFATLHYFANNFTFARVLPRLNWQDNLVFGAAGALAVVGLTGLLPDSPPGRPGAALLPANPQETALLTIFFIWLTITVYREILQRYRQTEDPGERSVVERLMIALFPLSVFLLGCVYILPYLLPNPLFFFSVAAPLSMLLFLSAARFQILELTEKNQNVLPLFAVTSLLVAVFFIKPEPIVDFRHILGSIPFLLASTLVGYYILGYFTQTFKQAQMGYDELLDKKMEQFSIDIGKLVTQQQLWTYLAEFFKGSLHITRIAIVTLQEDIRPYQIAYQEGFSDTEIQKLFQPGQSLLLDRLEHERHIIVKMDLPMENRLFQALDLAQIYLVIPLMHRSEISGVILLGGERQYMSVSRRNLYVFRLVSSQVAVALEKIRTLESMFQAQKMAGLGMLASQLAHDFRSFITITKMQLKQNPNPGLEKHAGYMEKLVNDLLNYARPQELRPTLVNINQLIDMSLEMVRVPETIQIDKNYTVDLPKIPLDVSQMRRVFVNLLENSVRAMRLNESGRIKITTKPLRSLSRLRPSPWLHVEILDEGIGIPEEYLERIFDPFFTRYKNEGGNGLGLAIVKQIITRHNGHIDVASKPGRGTVFNIRLPYQTTVGNGHQSGLGAPQRPEAKAQR